jgi:hypothetical protein
MATTASRPTAAVANGLMRAAVYDTKLPEGVKVAHRPPPARSNGAAGLMRAAVYDAKSPEGVKVIARKPPARSAGALLVRVKACGGRSAG